MRETKSRPNIVTYTTLVRAIGFTNEVDPMECLTFLKHARQDETFDEALFLEALEVCAARKSVSTAAAVLREVKSYGEQLRNTDRLVHGIAQVVHENEEQERILNEWTAEGLLTQEERVRITSPETLAASRGSAFSAACLSFAFVLGRECSHMYLLVRAVKTLGCLGHQTSESVRQAVVHHDITRLVERMHSGVAVST